MRTRTQQYHVVTVLLTVVAACLLVGLATAATPQDKPNTQQEKAPPERPAAPDYTETNAKLKETLGIEVIALRLTAGHQMLDFRYKIVDAEKAAPVMKEKKPYLIDNATGQQLPVPIPPKVGPLRSASQQPTAGRSYFIIFANPGGMVKAGATVTIVIGEAKIENIIVQ